MKPIEKCSFSERRQIAKLMADQVNSFIPRQSFGKSEEIEKNGFMPFNIATDQQIDEIVADLKTKGVYNSHVPHGDGVKRPLDQSREFSFGCYDLDDVISCPHLLELALNQEILDIAESYLECVPTLYSMNAWWSFPHNRVANTQTWHRDYDDYRFLAFFLYLTPTTKLNGAHCFMKGTHNQKLNDEDFEVFEGPAGTSFISDTYGIHKSLPLIWGERLVFWARYGLGETLPSKEQINQPSSKKLTNIKFDDKINYITRLILQ